MIERDQRYKAVNVAEMVVTDNPRALESYGLGSCVAVAMYDSRNKVGGMAHVMLPESKGQVRRKMRGKFADTAVSCMVEELKALGAEKSGIRCKIVGGSQMFSIPGAKSRRDSPRLNTFRYVGERNVEAVKEALEKNGVRLVAEDTGGDYGRSIRFEPHTGRMWIRSMEKGEKEL